jgi:ABC-type transport system substrate-binding protein
MVPFGLSSPAAVEAQGENYGSDGSNLPVGSGPFRVIAWDGAGIRLIPFGRHWSGAPVAAGLRFVVLPDPAARADAVAQGRAHGASLSASPPVSVSLTAPGLRLLSRPARSTAWLMLDHSRPPLDNPQVRRAISLALDRQRLAVEHFGPASQPASQLLPPGWLGHAEDIPAPAQDMAEARRIFAEEGIDGSFRLNIFVPETPRGYLPDPLGTAEAIGEMLEALGITPSVRALGLRQFLGDRESGRFTAWIGGWEAQSPDPDNLWFFHFGIPARFAAEGHYQNGDLARLLTSAQRMDTDSRRDVYLAAARTVEADMARIFLAHARPLVVVNQRLQGLEPGVMGFDDLSTVSLGAEPTAGPRASSTPSSDATPEEAAAGEDIPTAVPLLPEASASAPSESEEAPGEP